MSQEQKDSLTAIISVSSLIVALVWFISEPKFETTMLVLSTLATVLTLYASKKKIEKAQRRYIRKPRQLFKTSVVVWGPTQSGKSWLISAFAKNISYKYKEQINGLIYNLEQSLPKSNVAMPIHIGDIRNVPPTSQTKISTFRFERQRTSESFSQAISSFAHELTLIDMRGADLLAATLVPDKKFRQTLDTLANADIIVIALDPHIDIHRLNLDEDKNADSLLVDSYPDDDYPDIAMSPGLNGDEYAKLIKKLFQVLETMRPDKKRHYAVCLMKADSVIQNVYHNDTKGLINLCFGEKLINVFSSIDPKRLAMFTVSSAGFIFKKGEIIPNFNSGSLMDHTNWEPYGVEHPFFWAFEEIEKDILREKFNRTWWGKLVANRKLKKYTSYPKIDYELPKPEISTKANDENFEDDNPFLDK